MKIQELRSLIDRSGLLLKKLNKTTNKEEKEQITKEYKEIKKNIESVRCFIEYYSTVEINSCLISYFIENNIKVELHVDDNLIILDTGKIYNLGETDGFRICLTCLFEDEYEYFKDWDFLFKDFPDLKDYLWNYIREKVQNEKKERLSLINRRIEENNKKLNFYSDLKLIEKRKNELKIEKLDLESEKQHLENTLDEF